MPFIGIDETLDMYYEEDCHADPWGPEPQVVLFIHGMGESSRAWFAWVPHLSRRFRLLRIDQRGLGRSTVPPPGYEWSLQGLGEDVGAFLDAMGIDRVHLVAAKIGAAVALAFAAAHPERVMSLTVCSPLIDAKRSGRLSITDGGGLRGWAESTMRARLGSDASDAQRHWWTEHLFMATQERVVEEVHDIVGEINIAPLLPAISAPTLVAVSEGSLLQSLHDMRRFVGLIPRGRLAVLRGNAYHVAAVHPDAIAERVQDFIRTRDGDTSSTFVLDEQWIE